MPNNDIHGGTQSFVFDYMKYMDLDKYKIDFLVSNDAYAATEEYQKGWFNLIIANAREGQEKYKNNIINILQNYDIFHLHTAYWQGLEMETWAQLAGIGRVIIHSHGAGIYGQNSETIQNKLNIHMNLREKLNETMATDFWACSDAAGEWLFGDRISKNKIKIVHNAIDMREFQYNLNNRKIIREQLGIGKEYILGCCGRLSKIKNYEFAIELLKKINDIDNVKLLIVGSGEEEVHLKEMAAYYRLENKVIFVGWQQKINMYMHAMDILLVPSHYEGFGTVIVEAQAAGLPVIVNDKLTHESRLCDLVNYVPLEINAWVEKVKMLMGHKTRMNTREIIEKAGYSVETEAHKLQELYDFGEYL
ncbi:MAG: glycosyltransferase [Butyrivibrio sp.]